MKILVGTLLDSLPSLKNISIFLIFIMILFRILALQLFYGITENRCRLYPEPVSGKNPASPEYLRFCEKGGMIQHVPKGIYLFIYFILNVFF